MRPYHGLWPLRTSPIAVILPVAATPWATPIPWLVDRIGRDDPMGCDGPMSCGAAATRGFAATSCIATTAATPRGEGSARRECPQAAMQPNRCVVRWGLCPVGFLCYSGTDEELAARAEHLAIGACAALISGKLCLCLLRPRRHGGLVGVPRRHYEIVGHGDRQGRARVRGKGEARPSGKRLVLSLQALGVASSCQLFCRVASPCWIRHP